MKVLVAGIGNIFFGDDGFGVEVAARLAGQPQPAGVEVLDVGIRGVHLAYRLLDGYDLLVLVDAMPMGVAPGTLGLVEVDQDDLDAMARERGDVAVDAHTMDPTVVLRTLRSLGGRVGRVLVVGCEPATLEEGIGLSAPVGAAVDPAATMVRDLVTGTV